MPDDFLDFDAILSPKKDDGQMISDDQKKELALLDLREAATHRLNTLLDRSALRDVDPDDSRRLVALSPDLMSYDLPVSPDAPSSLAEPSGGMITADQYLYLFLLDNDYTPVIACKILGIGRSTPVLWRKQSKIFADCYKNIIASMADEAEIMTAQEAIYNPKANIERMFFVKRWLPEYRDNAPTPAPVAVQLNVTIDNQEIDTSVGYRQLDDDSDD